MNYFTKVTAILFLFFSAFAYAETQVAEPAIYTQDKPTIIATPDKSEFIIKLKSNATTGYSWFLRQYDKNMIEPVSHKYQHPVSQLVGAPGFELWTFRVRSEGFTVPQVTYIRFIYSRPWEPANQTSTQVEFKVTTLPTSAPATSHPQKSE